ncbi:MAG: metallophosphoesterase [Clostridia bacterium]|nr:metallophosphoesterase [Clostridia bacterium]
MVRLGIVSDSHRDRFWTERFLVVANRECFDAVFHLGDGEGEARWLSRRLDMLLYFVPGNCDRSDAAPWTVKVCEGHRILACHGHQYDVKWGLDALSYRAEECGADIALYGHTHEAAAEYVGKVLTLNPGALMGGRYAVLTLDGKRVIPTLLEL